MDSENMLTEATQKSSRIFYFIELLMDFPHSLPVILNID